MHFFNLFAFVLGVAAMPATTDLGLAARNAVAAADTDIAAAFIQLASRGWRKSSTCAVHKAVLPTFAGDALPAPQGKVAHILLGRGTQNYTCDTSKPDEAPKAVGALASLYDASCLVSHLPLIHQYWPMLAVLLGNPSQKSEHDFMGLELMGHHYFADPKSPIFDLRTCGGDRGYVQVAKDSSSDAPKSARPNSVPWLYLKRNEDVTAAEADKTTFSGVYRVNTVDGAAPKTCAGQKASFTVPYAAEYWLYE